MAARERKRPRNGRRVAAGILALATLFAASPALAEGWIHDVPAPGDGVLVVLLERGVLEIVPRPGSDRIRIEASARGLGASSVEFTLTREQVDGRSELHLASSEEEWLRWLSLPPRVQVKAFVPSHVAVELISKGRRTEVVKRGVASGADRPGQRPEFTRPVSLSISRATAAQNGVGPTRTRLQPAIHQPPASR